MLLLSGPNMAGNEWKYVKDCLDTGWLSAQIQEGLDSRKEANSWELFELK